MARLAEGKSMVSTQIADADLAWLTEEAERRKLSRSEVIRNAITLYQNLPLPLRAAISDQPREATAVPEAARA